MRRKEWDAKAKSKLYDPRLRLLVLVTTLVFIVVAIWLVYSQMNSTDDWTRTLLGRAICWVNTGMSRNELTLSVGSQSKPVVFVVGLEDTLTDVANRLVELDLIYDSLLFECYVGEKKIEIEVGEYTLDQTMMLVEIADYFDQGLTNEKIFPTIEGSD